MSAKANIVRPNWRETVKKMSNVEKACYAGMLLAVPLGVLFTALDRVELIVTESVGGVVSWKLNRSATVGDFVRFQFVSPTDDGSIVVITKRLVCGPGDYLHVDETSVTCNGRHLGDVKAATDTGYPLPVARFSGNIPSNQAFVMGSHEWSYDSRYWGLLDIRQMEAVKIVF